LGHGTNNEDLGLCAIRLSLAHAYRINHPYSASQFRDVTGSTIRSECSCPSPRGHVKIRIRHLSPTRTTASRSMERLSLIDRKLAPKRLKRRKLGASFSGQFRNCRLAKHRPHSPRTALALTHGNAGEDSKGLYRVTLMQLTVAGALLVAARPTLQSASCWHARFPRGN